MLLLGLLFHAGILLVHGLLHFSLAMSAALILYLRPLSSSFRWPSNLKALLEPSNGIEPEEAR